MVLLPDITITCMNVETMTYYSILHKHIFRHKRIKASIFPWSFHELYLQIVDINMDIACGQETQGYVLNTQFSVFLHLKISSSEKRFRWK